MLWFVWELFKIICDQISESFDHSSIHVNVCCFTPWPPVSGARLLAQFHSRRGDWSQTQGARKTSRCFEGGASPGKHLVFYKGTIRYVVYMIQVSESTCTRMLIKTKHAQIWQVPSNLLAPNSHLAPWRLLDWRLLELRSCVCMSIQQNFGAYAITSQIISIFWWFWWKCFHWFYYRENPQIVSSCWFQTWCFRGLKIAVFKMWKEGGPILRKCAFFGGQHLFSEAIFPSNLAPRLFSRGFSQGGWKVLTQWIAKLLPGGIASLWFSRSCVSRRFCRATRRGATVDDLAVPIHPLADGFWSITHICSMYDIIIPTWLGDLKGANVCKYIIHGALIWYGFLLITEILNFKSEDHDWSLRLSLIQGWEPAGCPQ